MAETDMLVLGEVNADIVLTGDVVPRFGQQEHLVEADVVLGGAGAIAACQAARLGLRVAFAGLAGDDPLGRFAVAAIAAAGVDVSGVVVRAGERSGLGVVLARTADDRATLTYPGLIPVFEAIDVSDELVAAARHVHVGAYFLQTGLHAGLAGLFARARAAGATTSLDPNGDPSGRFDLTAILGEVDLLLPNADEARRLGGSGDVEMAARRLARRGPTVVVKLGRAGALAVTPDGASAYVPAPAGIAAIDATGAGDSFDAGLIAARLDGRDIIDALALAVACGALSTRAAGGTSSQPDRIEAETVARDVAATARRDRRST